METQQNPAAIVLAGGKGTRIGQTLPKVLYPIVGKPMIHYTLNLLDELGIEDKVVVVGFRADEVKAAIGRRCEFAFQEKQLGSGHALITGLHEIMPDVRQVLVLNGDDSAFYEPDTIRTFIADHLSKNSVLSFITVEKPDPTSFGRILRDENGNVTGIREEKVALESEKQIKEVNAGCYLFNTAWLKANSQRLKKSKVGEYYITDFIEIAIRQKHGVNAFKIKNENEWYGINMKSELEKANVQMYERYVERKKPTVFFVGIDHCLLNSKACKNLLITQISQLTATLKGDTTNEKRLEDKFWEIYESVRSEKGFVDIPEAISRFAQKTGLEKAADSFKNIFLTAPFEQFFYPGAMDFLKNLQKFGKIVILEEGDLVYAPIKIRSLKREGVIEDYFIFEDLKHSIPMVLDIYQGWRHVIIDDRPDIIKIFQDTDTRSKGLRLRQGKYADTDCAQDTYKGRLFEVSDWYEARKIINTI